MTETLDNDLFDKWLLAGMIGLDTETARELLDEVQALRDQIEPLEDEVERLEAVRVELVDDKEDLQYRIKDLEADAERADTLAYENDELRARLAALGARAIETAPRVSGRRVLLLFPEIGWQVGFWYDDRNAPRPEPFWTSVLERKGLNWTRANQPTHWAPLPPEVG